MTAWGLPTRPAEHALPWWELGIWFNRDSEGVWISPDGQRWHGPYDDMGGARGAAKLIVHKRIDHPLY